MGQSWPRLGWAELGWGGLGWGGSLVWFIMHGHEGKVGEGLGWWLRQNRHKNCCGRLSHMACRLA